jgi:4'-phosphopantetheinyl transferase
MASEASAWTVAPSSLSLSDGDVHVWQAHLDLPSSSCQELEHLLTADERARAARLRSDNHRSHFVAARGLLRTILGSYLRVAPDAIRFSYGSHGKPALAQAPVGAALRFNLAHSHGLGLIAVTRSREVGIDLERMREGVRTAAIARRFFSPGEQAALAALEEEPARLAFFRIWACKEAYLKAIGAGISRPLQEIDVTLDPAPRLHVTGVPGETTRWSLRELDPDPSYAAAVAVEGGGWRLSCWRWRSR